MWRLEPSSFESIAFEYLVNDGQVPQISEAIDCAHHWLLDQLLAATVHQVDSPLFEELVAEA